VDIDQISELCEHVHSGDYPFQVELVIDDQLGLTDGIVACRFCGRRYLLEMLDWRGTERLFRISALAADHARRLIRDLTRGSCDVRRAGDEVQHLKSTSSFAPWLILVDTRQPRIDRVAPLPAGTTLPGASWRSLPCDGEWLELVKSDQSSGSRRSSSAIVKG